MKGAYPIIITKEDDWYVVEIPDFESATQGHDLPDAMYMARDAIGLLGITREDDGQALPAPSKISDIRPDAPDAIVTLVDVDFTEYRLVNDQRSVKKNCTLPSWLEYRARMEGISFSDALQRGLKQALGIS